MAYFKSVIVFGYWKTGFLINFDFHLFLVFFVQLKSDYYLGFGEDSNYIIL